jgi:hypothetical protein
MKQLKVKKLNDDTNKESDNDNNTNDIAQLDKNESLIDQLKMVMDKNCNYSMIEDSDYIFKELFALTSLILSFSTPKPSFLSSSQLATINTIFFSFFL